MTAPTPGLVETLERAAQFLDDSAAAIRSGFYTDFSRRWWNQDMKAKHWECRAVAQRLRRAAKYFGANPLGGPAKVFDAMADRIRAGEDYYAVLADHGFKVDKPRGKG
jgi:hypothetical protein